MRGRRVSEGWGATVPRNSIDARHGKSLSYALLEVEVEI